MVTLLWKYFPGARCLVWSSMCSDVKTIRTWKFNQWYDYLGKFMLFSWVILFNLLLFEMNTKFANHPNFGKANIRVRISIMVRKLSRVRTFVQALVEGAGYHPPGDGSAPDWCVCGRCRQMPTELEQVCCRKSPAHCTSALPVYW